MGTFNNYTIPRYTVHVNKKTIILEQIEQGRTRVIGANNDEKSKAISITAKV
jgi:hypothetical protein